MVQNLFSQSRYSFSKMSIQNRPNFRGPQETDPQQFLDHKLAKNSFFSPGIGQQQLLKEDPQNRIGKTCVPGRKKTKNQPPRPEQAKTNFPQPKPPSGGQNQHSTQKKTRANFFCRRLARHSDSGTFWHVEEPPSLASLGRWPKVG